MKMKSSNRSGQCLVVSRLFTLLPAGALFLAIILFPPVASIAAPLEPLIALPGADFVMGDRAGDANEAPRTLRVSAFRIMRHEVTNAQFAEFVAATGHVTDSERGVRLWQH